MIQMFINSTKCDIYIGKGAGKKLFKDIQNAKKSIRIVSPYLSHNLISELIQLRKKYIAIQLITTDKIEDNNRNNIKKLIIQNKRTDIIAVNERKDLKRRKNVTLLFFIMNLAFSYMWYIIAREKFSLFYLIPAPFLFLLFAWYSRKWKAKKIFTYNYSQLFPFKVFFSPYISESSDTFIHSKIYLIDNKIAYLGSLNFTNSGMKDNYETRIRTEESEAINGIKAEFQSLFHHSKIPAKDIQEWGKELYDEPIN